MSKGGGQGSFAQMQEPGLDMDMGGFGGGGPQPIPAVEPPQFDDRMGQFNNRMGMPSFNPRLVSLQPIMQDGGLGSKGGRSNPYQPDGISPPGQIRDAMARPAPIPPPRPVSNMQDFNRRAMDQIRLLNPDFAQGVMALPLSSGVETIGKPGMLPSPTIGKITHGRETIGYPGDEITTGGIKPPRGPVKLEPIKTQPLPSEPMLSDGPDFRPPPVPDMPPTPPRRIDIPAIPSDMLEDIESRGTVGPGGGTGDRTGSFRDAIREFRDEFRYQPMPRRQPPIFGPPRNFPFPMPRPPRMPPRQPPRMPGRNTQFQMPFFGSPYGQMNPYAGQFSGYGVPSNMFSFAQPHYEPYVPQAYTPPPPVMQLPPGQGSDAFTAGFGGQGIGGFGRYNLGLARRQFGGR